MPADTQKRTVLAVGSSCSIQDILAGHQWKLETARDAAAALQLIQERPYDVILTDVETPGEADLEFLKDIRRMRPSAKVIVMSSEGAPEAVVASIREHAFSYFTRPFDPDAFRELLAEAADLPGWDDGIEVLSAEADWITLELRCRQYTADRVMQFLRELKSDLPAEERDDTATAFREMLLNAIEHGGKFDPDRKAQVSCVRTDRIILYHIKDPGLGFSRDSLPHAAVSNPPDAPAQHVAYRDQHGLRPGGFGMLVAKNLVDELIYNQQGNEVLLVKYLNTPADH